MANGTLRGSAILISAVLVAVLIASSAQAQSLVDKARRDEIVGVADDDPLMARAISKARETLPGFLAIAEHPTPGLVDFGVKVAVKRVDGTEYFWISPFVGGGDQFAGRVANKPRTMKSIVAGQTVTFSRNEIVDWTYMNGKRMMGNYTARALLQKATPTERAEFKKRYGLDADF